MTINDSGARLDKALALSPHNQASAAREIDVSVQRLHQWITRSKVPNKFIQPLADLLDVRHEWLALGQEPMSKREGHPASWETVHLAIIAVDAVLSNRDIKWDSEEALAMLKKVYAAMNETDI